ncbi:hypothetical protein HGA11_07300 [Mycolicibacterium septicum DSM 44393]|uniref:Luciferase-like domain-containing protein n=1 Tax=Mycolicibacterium septicum DSM 44393 TaxID=1341646 RepID=A0A7X6MPQ8_9MYCO|nr:hypothetical protein [Mycolicibacterium septicum]NKZ10782.1 hypothetical protein [Mycolicibacterium septicum DSM 44393]
MDLYDLGRKAGHIRELCPAADVLVYINFVIASNAATARATLESAEAVLPAVTLGYVGTPYGLANLIGDIHAMGLADGAILHPLIRGAELNMVFNSVLPQLGITTPKAG